LAWRLASQGGARGSWGEPSSGNGKGDFIGRRWSDSADHEARLGRQHEAQAQDWIVWPEFENSEEPEPGIWPHTVDLDVLRIEEAEPTELSTAGSRMTDDGSAKDVELDVEFRRAFEAKLKTTDLAETLSCGSKDFFLDSAISRFKRSFADFDRL
jgi:hypothetical protein